MIGSNLRRIGGGVCAALLTAVGTASAAPVFESNFDGASGNIGDMTQWTQAWNSRTQSSATVVNNTGQFLIEGGKSSGTPSTGWHYTGIRADSAQGTAQLFNPATAEGIRVETQINYMGDKYYNALTGSPRSTQNAFLNLYLTPNEYTSNPWGAVGQKITANVVYNRGINTTAVGTAPTYELALRVINKTTPTGTDVGVDVYKVTLSGLDMDKLSEAERDNLKIAVEVRDQNGGEIRLGYQKITVAGGTATPADWIYSDWKNPANTGLSTNLPANWMSGFANNTRLYLESNVNPQTQGVVQFDNVTVVPEPTALGVLGVGSLLLLRRR